MRVIKYEDHNSCFFTSLQDLYENETLVDVTLINEEVSIKAHKVVLASSSPYFRKLFEANPSKHPIVLMNGVETNYLKAILNFLYTGETSVEDDNLTGLERVADHFHIAGLVAALGEAKRKAVEVADEEATPIKSAGDVQENTMVEQKQSETKYEINIEEPETLAETINESGDETIKEKQQNVSFQCPPVPANTPVAISSYKTLATLISKENSQMSEAESCKSINDEFHINIPGGNRGGDFFNEPSANYYPSSNSVGAQTQFDDQSESVEPNLESLSCCLKSDTTVTTQNELAEHESLPCEQTYSRSTPSVFKSSEMGCNNQSSSLLGQDFSIASKPYTSESQKFSNNDIYLINPNSDPNMKEIFEHQTYSSYASEASNTSMTELKCFICEESFTQIELLQVHYKENHFPISYPCPWCMNKGLRAIKNIQSAENVKFFTYVCCYCKKIFGSKQYLH